MGEFAKRYPDVRERSVVAFYKGLAAFDFAARTLAYNSFVSAGFSVTSVAAASTESIPARSLEHTLRDAYIERQAKTTIELNSFILKKGYGTEIAQQELAADIDRANAQLATVT